jgi:hypothetical protein
MARNLRRADPNKRDEIRTSLQICKEAGFSDRESMYYSLNMIRDGTGPEWCWARYYREIGDKPPDRDFLNLYRNYERYFNSREDYPDDMIIGIKSAVKNKKGRVLQIWFRGLAIGQSAEDMAKFCDVIIAGWKKKQTTLYSYARDSNLKNRHESRLADLKRRITQFKRRRRASGNSSSNTSNSDEEKDN